VTIRNDQLDDMVLLRADGTPVYMLAVVVDDYDMGVTHVIRGDDHLNNAARQMMIYSAMGWDLPVYAHIPLIHGPDGKKLSKRHGALGAQEYQGMGYPAAGMRNYLARLGWSHGDDEFFTDAQALEWFDLGGIGTAMYCLKERSRTFPELLDKAAFVLASRPIVPDEKSAKNLDTVSRGILNELTPHLQNVSWTRDDLETVMAGFCEAHDTKFGKLAGPLRAALAGRAVTPSVYDMMLVLGREETLARLNDAGA